MAALGNNLISLQYKISPSARISRTLASGKPYSLSFSATLPSLNLSFTTFPRSRGGSTGAKMSAPAADSYATALADIVKSNKTLDKTSLDMENIDKFFADQEISTFFANPTIEVEKKRQLIDEIAKSAELQPHTTNFLNILIDAKRIDLVKEIVKEFELVYNKITNTELAIVSSVVKLEPMHLARIAKQVQKLTGAKNVRIKSVIDRSLVAGFTVRYGSSGSKLIDLSVKKQLEEISAQLDLGDIQLA